MCRDCFHVAQKVIVLRDRIPYSVDIACAFWRFSINAENNINSKGLKLY